MDYNMLGKPSANARYEHQHYLRLKIGWARIDGGIFYG